MHLDLYFFAFAIPAVIFAGMAKGGFGAASGIVVTPFLALILTPGQAIGLMLPLMIVMDIAALRAYWGKWDLKISLRLIYGAIPGLIIAGLVYQYTNPDVFRLLIGLVAIGFVLYQGGKTLGWLKPSQRKMGKVGGMFWGSASGFTSFVSHAGGPPASVYLLTQQLDKTTYHATGALAFFVINVLKVVPYLALGIFSPDTIQADLYLLPVALIGVVIGVQFNRRVSDRVFFLLTYVFLFVTGLKLIFDALT